MTTDMDATIDALRDGYLTLCRLTSHQPGVAWADTGDVAWGMTPLPIAPFNRVVRIRLSTADADARIDEVRAGYVTAGVPESWWLDEGATPDDVGERLERRGLHGDRVPGMRIEAADVPELVIPEGVTLSWTDGPDELRIAMHHVSLWFGLPADVAERVATLTAPGGAPGSPVHTVVASMDGHPVASAQGIDVDGAVAIYNVATLEAARGRGIGRAVTTAVLEDAVARGARFGVLESSDMGHPVYLGIGFRDVISFRVYEAPAD
jgi:ribosomal protein S18 acetylase RimI-like enzyme